MNTKTNRRRIVAFASGAVLLCTVALTTLSWKNCMEWGFFGHRRLNRLAVFTLPPEMLFFFKHHIEYLTEHAVDPDKRRYASRFEAVRHYIDLDKWGKYPFDSLPRVWVDALLQHTSWEIIRGQDTLVFFMQKIASGGGELAALAGAGGSSQLVDMRHFRWLGYGHLLPQYYEEAWYLSCDTLYAWVGDMGSCDTVRLTDHFSAHGILPYYLPQHQQRLSQAFRRRDAKAILQLSAELGHYIGDAHVPLHTTSNYNGQQTDQLGIHAFWESRIPELFADASYDYFVGKAQYIRDPVSYYWQMVLDSHLLVDSVLGIEKRLSGQFPRDNMYCYDERLGQQLRTQCRDYALAYQEAMRGMVEARWRATIMAIGSAWYTAWVDAGQPDLRSLAGVASSQEEQDAQRELDRQVEQGSSQGRPHENRR